MTPAKVLIIDDNPAEFDWVKPGLEARGYAVQTATHAQEALDLAKEHRFDAVVTDLYLPGLEEGNRQGGFEIVATLRKMNRDLPVILWTAKHSADVAIEASKLGAFTYMTKPLPEKMENFVAELATKIGSALQVSRPVRDPVNKDRTVPARDAIIGQSRAMLAVFEQIGRLAALPAPVVIQGERGTGKDLVARVIHRHSNRADQPFIIIRTAGHNQFTLDYTLFGCERGSIPGADQPQVGLLEHANHGTVYIDEVALRQAPAARYKLPKIYGSAGEAKLAVFLKEKRFQRLGSEQWHTADVRLIVATSVSLKEFLIQNQFNRELYYQLKAWVTLPRLYERKEDIPELVEFFAWRSADELGLAPPSIVPDAVEFLQQQLWPGNVRQLENVVARAALYERGRTISLEAMEAAYRSQFPEGTPNPERTSETRVVSTTETATSETVTISTGTVRLPMIHDHQLRRRVGAGGYGEVWLAQNVQGRFRAVKVVYRNKFPDAGPYEEEYAGLEKVEPISRKHECIVGILHIGKNDSAGYFYYVMEAADDRTTGQEIIPDSYDARTLDSELKSRGRIPVEECVDIALSLTAGLEHLHKHGLVHRDIKPSNVIFFNGAPRLADIGLVGKAGKCFGGGTAGYTPPEKHGWPQGDVYSLGRVLYVVSTGQEPDKCPEPPKDMTLSAEMTELTEIIKKACEHDCTKRYQSVDEFRSALTRLRKAEEREQRPQGLLDRIRWLLR